MSVSIVKTYDQVGRKEDISDIISNIAPTKTPFQTMIGTEGIHNILHQWQEDSLIAAGVNAQVEGATAISAVQNPTTMLNNTTQIFMKTASVSGTADVVKTYGRDKELAYQLSLRSAELKRDFEYALIGVNQALVTGSDSVARQFANYIAQLSSATTGSYLSANYYMGATNGANSGPMGGTSGSAAALSETAISQVMAQLYTNGVEANTIMVKPSDAVLVAAFQAGGLSNRTIMVQNGNKTLTNAVDKYDTPYGAVDVVMNRFQLTSSALIFDPSFWKKLVLRNWFRETLAKTGDSTQVMITGEFSLKLKNQAAAGAVTNIT